MRFMSMIRLDENTGQVPSQRLIDDMTRLIDELRASGKLLDTGGLQPTAQGRRVRLHNGKLSNIDGPFTEAKEVIGGYAVLQADSLDEATQLTRRFLEVHGTEWNLECEVRQIEEPGDCG
ncbi:MULTISPECIES: YciI family protein [unclassified Lysobacter]|uniref:YciI family protein n=1 Tax=unclassified Lysobacter TaxID=2635362 RepID=UPI001C23C909|nr:YciI family protein [Lysobacter sp. MMG2]MBU8978047.1 transcriptional regulator [Lysobacter sp. MMG2]